MRTQGVSFSIARHAAWAPGLDTPEAWREWARAPFPIVAGAEAGVRGMAPMLRRRAGALGKMALEVAYECLEERRDVPTVFCSRHGEVARAVDLLGALARGELLSPTAFGMAVHNASAGLFSIARADRANHVALAGGASTIEHAVIEACGLLADGAPMVLLVACDTALPAPFGAFEDCAEQPHAWAWLMVPAGAAPFTLSWSADAAPAPARQQPGGLEVLRFQLGGAAELERRASGRRWRWSRHA
ncbi:beta-ketoacyl synthase chain length factor [Janthinobacterium sp.]|uniref:beta-ketoacyl synthase chain length factor n=1 Tax=Janthinobacterium sp. TaxID=1871054 RepID=UPI00293D51A1|nr:beta-ketoacyl synthase chain length factor [Janthinobacterium sp.]